MDKQEKNQRNIASGMDAAKEADASGVGITRRTFIRRSLVAGAAVGAASQGLFPIISTLDVAYGAQEFRFAWISDTHLYPKTLNTRFVEKAERAVKTSRR